VIRLSCLNEGHAPEQKAMLEAIRERSGREPLGVVKTLLYRGEVFGAPFSDELDDVMRGPSEWAPAERELFAGFASQLNQCLF
jgi:hypothetical protein